MYLFTLSISVQKSPQEFEPTPPCLDRDPDVFHQLLSLESTLPQLCHLGLKGSSGSKGILVQVAAFGGDLLF